MPDTTFADFDLADAVDNHETEEREELRKQILLVAGRIGAKIRELARQGDLEGLKALAVGQTVISDEEAQARIDTLTHERDEQRKRADNAERQLSEASKTIKRLESEKADDPDKTTTKSFGSKVRGRLGSR